jgi:hypothetical protein
MALIMKAIGKAMMKTGPLKRKSSIAPSMSVGKDVAKPMIRFRRAPTTAAFHHFVPVYANRKATA